MFVVGFKQRTKRAYVIEDKQLCQRGSGKLLFQLPQKLQHNNLNEGEGKNRVVSISFLCSNHKPALTLNAIQHE